MKKKILFIVPFDSVYPPMNGGTLRSFHLMNQLAKYAELTVIINQDKNSFLNAAEKYPDIGNCNVISTKTEKAVWDIFSLLPLKLSKALRYRYWNRSLKGPADSNFLLIYPVLKKELKKNKFDFAILEDISILNLSKLIKRYQPSVTLIYDAYNVNSKIAKTDLINNLISEENYSKIKKTESSLSDYVDHVFTCSGEDLQQLSELNNEKIKGIVIPNGVEIAADISSYDEAIFKDPNNIIFCGSLDYFPNTEGLIWFCRKIFPLILKENPAVHLLVVGKGEPADDLRKCIAHNSIIFVGMVDKVSDYYKKATVAIVPLLSGSGTRLKLLEAMGNNVAVVSTYKGAEGIQYINDRNILIADGEMDFANSVLELISDKVRSSSMASAALEFVKQNYDWNVIGKKMELFIEDTLTAADNHERA